MPQRVPAITDHRWPPQSEKLVVHFFKKNKGEEGIKYTFHLYEVVEKPQRMRKNFKFCFSIRLRLKVLCLHAWQWKLLLKMIAPVHVMYDINFPILINISTMMINCFIWRLPFRGLALPFNHSKLSSSTSSYLFKARSLQGLFTNMPL